MGCCFSKTEDPHATFVANASALSMAERRDDLVRCTLSGPQQRPLLSKPRLAPPKAIAETCVKLRPVPPPPLVAKPQKTRKRVKEAYQLPETISHELPLMIGCLQGVMTLAHPELTHFVATRRREIAELSQSSSKSAADGDDVDTAYKNLHRAGLAEQLKFIRDHWSTHFQEREPGELLTVANLALSLRNRVAHQSSLSVKSHRKAIAAFTQLLELINASELSRERVRVLVETMVEHCGTSAQLPSNTPATSPHVATESTSKKRQRRAANAAEPSTTHSTSKNAKPKPKKPEKQPSPAKTASTYVENSYEQALERIRRRDFGNAIALANRALVETPKNTKRQAELHAMNARCRFELGQYVHAIQDAQNALSRNGKLVDAYNWRAQALYALGRDKEASKACKRGLAVDPTHQGLLQVARVLGDETQCPPLPSGKEGTSKFLAPSENSDTASKWTSESCCERKKDTATDDTADTINPLSPQTSVNHELFQFATAADNQFDTRDTDQAPRTKEEAASGWEAPHDPIVSNSERGLIRGDTRAIEKDPTNGALFCVRSRHLFELSEFEMARRDAEKAIGLRPSRQEGYVRLLDALLALHSFVEAAAVCKWALSNNKWPQNSAFASWDKKVAVEGVVPDKAELRGWWHDDRPEDISGGKSSRNVLSMAGYKCMEQAEYKEAERLFTKAICKLAPETDPLTIPQSHSKARLFGFRGRCRLRQGKYEAALVDARLAIRYFPANPEWYVTTVGALAALNRVEDAVGACEAGLMEVPGDAELLSQSFKLKVQLGVPVTNDQNVMIEELDKCQSSCEDVERHDGFSSEGTDEGSSGQEKFTSGLSCRSQRLQNQIVSKSERKRIRDDMRRIEKDPNLTVLPASHKQTYQIAELRKLTAATDADASDGISDDSLGPLMQQFIARMALVGNNKREVHCGTNAAHHSSPITDEVASSTGTVAIPDHGTSLSEGERRASPEALGTVQLIRNDTRAIEKDPDNGALYCIRSRDLFRLSEFEMARRDAEKAIDLHPSRLEGYVRLLDALFALHSFVEAAAVCEWALSSKWPQSPVLFSWVSKIGAEGISIDKAELGDWWRDNGRGETSGGRRSRNMLSMAGYKCMEQAEYKEAERLFTKAICKLAPETDPLTIPQSHSKARLFGFRGRCRLRQGKYEAALVDARLAIRYFPANPEWYVTAVGALAALNRVEDAVGACEAGLMEVPGDAELLSQQAILNLKLDEEMPQLVSSEEVLKSPGCRAGQTSVAVAEPDAEPLPID